MKKVLKLLLFLIIIAVAIFFIKVSLFPRIPLIGKKTDSKVYIALGYHANLYHSYRIDTNDEAGFGKDIRIIRKIIKTMDEYNEKGSNVCGVWDIENLFSLEEILPVYAPDIIEDINRRVKEGRDEVIIMSYNNSLASAMTEEEFKDSISRAITNQAGSGLLDIFGGYSPIVRPQEMMTTPGNFGLYKDLGINTVVLYYSAITFDAMRVFLRPLSPYEAHNPLTYKNADTGEEITVIPTYNHGDMAENVSITKWARDLHRKQLRGKIEGDVLISINVDADDSYWYGYKFPAYLAWLPNTGGLSQIIEEVDALDYAEFTTLSKYLETHKPVAEITFGQDTADGNFDGYDSWAQKSNSHEYWTTVMEDRWNHDATELAYEALGKGEIPAKDGFLLSRSYELRLRLLSTTNFGMAAPFLAKNREKAAEEIAVEMLTLSREAWGNAKDALTKKINSVNPPPPPVNGMSFVDSFIVLSKGEAQDKSGFAFVTFDLSGLSVSDRGFYVVGPDGVVTTPFVVEEERDEENNITMLKLFISGLSDDSTYFLFSGPSELYPRSEFETTAGAGILRNKNVKIEITNDGIIEGIYFNNKKRLEGESLRPKVVFIKGEDKIDLFPHNFDVEVERNGSSGVACVRLFGDFDVPEVEGGKPGYVDYRLTLLDGVPYLFFEGEIRYPETPRNDLMGIGSPPELKRRIDRGWYETAPAELILSSKATKESPFKVIKKNFLDIESSYLVDYFKHSDENLNLASINNHITNGYVAAVGDDGGIALAMDDKVLSNFAFCPMKMTYSDADKKLSLRLNPFGAYFGPQYYQPTWGDRAGFDVAIMSGQQYYSAAPTYNGYSGRFSLLIAFFDKDYIPYDINEALVAFSDPPVIVTGGRIGVIERETYADPPSPPKGLVYATDGEKHYLLWDEAKGKPLMYEVSLGKEPGKYDEVFETEDTSFPLSGLSENTTYYASVTSIFDDGTVLKSEDEISFVPGEAPSGGGGMSLPVSLQLRVLWAGIMALIN